ncbi:MAG: dicarboxylate/amino acid:cation symporter [Kiritimatiellae bacterium]|nr:dicarboxylate/amino acid:cation symporter [Kiritimatiellia bacterium]
MKKYLYFRIPLFVRILTSFVLGIGFGYLLYINSDAKWVENTVNIIAPFGNVLVAMLKMIVIPIIFFSLIEGASNLPVKKFGRLGGGVLLWYFSTSVFAAIFGCILAKIVNPSLDTSLVTKTFGSQLSQISQMRAGGSGSASFGDFFVSLFANPFEALSNSLFLPIIIFAILFGIACRVVADTDSKHSQAIDTLLIVVKAILNACFKIIEWILEYFPIGIFALTTVNFAKYGTDLFGPYIKIIAGVGVGVILMLVFIYPLLIYICTRVNPYKILWKIRQPVLTAFITRSSSATLPVSFQTATKEFKIKNELSSFSLPLGATINMDGVCIHLPIFAILAANIFGMPMTPLALFGLVVSIVFASVGAGGIPGGSVFLLFMVLGNMGLDEAQTMLIAALALGINPILDMFETACNVAGDNVCTYIVAKRNNMFEE